MSIRKLQGLRGLRGLSDLSEAEQNKFLLDNAKVLSKYEGHPMRYGIAADRLYNNQKFINTFGMDAFNQYNDGTKASYDLRNQMTHNKLVTDALKDNFGSDGNFNELASFLDVDGMYDLLNNDEYLTDKEMRQKYLTNLNAAKRVGKTYDKAMSNPYVDYLGQGFMQIGKQSAAQTPLGILNKDKERNKEILDRLKSESQKRREEAIQGEADMIYANILATDDSGKQSLAKSLKDFNDIAKDSQYYNTFKNSRWMKDYSAEDKLKDYSKYLALKSKYGEGVARNYLERNMQDKVAEAQDGSFTGNTLKGVLTTAWSDIGSNVALFANMGSWLNSERMAILNLGKDPDKPIYDKKGNIVDYKENDNFWTNPAYWNNVYKYNTFSPTEIKAIQERGGVSEDVNVRASGYTPDFLSWDTVEEGFKQGGHVLAGIAETALTGGFGKAIGWSGKAALKGIGLSAKAMQTASKWGTITNDMFVTATTGLEGAQLEAMGTFDEQMDSAREKINAEIGRELSDYQQSINYNSREARAGINAFYNQLKAKDNRRVALGNREGVKAFPLSDETLKAQAKQLYTNQLLGAKQKELQELHKKDEMEAAKVAAKAYGTNFVMDYIKNIPLTTGIQKFKIAKGAMRGAFDDTIKDNIVADATTGGVRRVLNKVWDKKARKFVEKEGGDTKRYASGKQLGKELIKQLGGGFADEYLDGINASFSGGVGNNMFDNYIRKNYDPKAYDATIDSFLGNTLAGLSEGIDGITDRQNLYEGFIGMISPIATATINPNIAYRPKDTWKAIVDGTDVQGNKLNRAERVSSILMNPLLNAYADAKEKDRALDRTVEAVNAVVSANKDKISDAAKLVSVLDNYEGPITPNGFSVLDYKDNKLYNSFTLINALNSLENMDGGVNSKLYKDTIHTIQGLAEGALSKEELDNEIDMALGDKDNKSILEDKNAREEAAKRLQKNAKYFMEMKDRMTEIQNTFANSPNLMKENPLVLNTLMYNLVATDDYRKRLQSIEDELGLSHTDAESMFTPDYNLRYGTDQAKKRAIAARERELGKVQKEIDKIQSSIDYNERKMKVLERQQELEAPYKDGYKEYTKEIQKIKNLTESQKFQLKTLEEEKGKLTDEKDEINKIETNKGITKLFLTKEDLLHYDVRDIAYVFDEDNKSNFSEGRKAVIDSIKASLLQKDPEAMRKIADASILATRIEDAKTAYNRIMNNKELASNYLAAVESVRERDAMAESIQRQIKEHYGKIESAYISRKEEPEIFRNEILQTTPELIEAYMEDHPNQADAVKPYYELLKFDSDAKAVITNSNYSTEDKLSMLGTLLSLQSQSNTREELESKIEELIDSKDLDIETRNRYDSLMSKMESLGHQRNTSIVEERKQRKQREEEEKKKKEEEQKKVEEAAREAAEKKTSEAVTTEDMGKVPTGGDDESITLDNPFDLSDVDNGKEINTETSQVDNPTNGEIEPRTANPGVTKREGTGKEVPINDKSSSQPIEEEDLRQIPDGVFNAKKLFEDDYKNQPIDMGEIYYGTKENPKKGNLYATRIGDKISFTIDNVDGKKETLSIAPNEYEVIADEQEERLFDESKINKGFYLDSNKKIASEGPLKEEGILYSGYVENGKAKIGLKYGSKSMTSAALTFFKTSGDFTLNSHSDKVTLLKPAILTQKERNGQTYYELESKGELYFGDIKNNTVNKENGAFIANSIEKKDGDWYFIGNFAGDNKQTQVKVKDNFDIDKAIERQQAVRKAELGAKDIVADSKNLIDNGDTIQTKSETINEQAEDNVSNENIQVSDTNDDAATENGRGLQNIETTTYTLGGNAMSRYEPKPLEEDGILVNKKGTRGPNDTMNQYYAWMDAAGIKLQNIIDQELARIIKKNPHAKVKFMTVVTKDNATHDNTMTNHLMLVLDYDNSINKGITGIHNDDNGGVIESNGKKYLVIGTASYGDNNLEKRKLYFRIGNKNTKLNGDLGLIIPARKKFFDEHPNERFYVDEQYTTEIVPSSQIPGYIVRQLTTDKNSEYRNIKDVLADKERNPMGYDMKSLSWGIQEKTQFLLINAKAENVMVPRNPMNNLGSAFVLMPASNGKMVPSYLKVLKYTEMKDGALKDRINSLLQEVVAPNYNTRINAAIELSKIFYFDKDGNNILVGKDDGRHRNEVSLVHGDNVLHTSVLNSDFDRAKFMQAFEDLNPRINITADVLMDDKALDEYNEAGALMTDAALFGTAGSSYSIYALDSNGKMIMPEQPTNNVPKASNSDFKDSRQQIVFNKEYYRWADGSFYLNGKLVTDEKKVNQLQHIQNILNNELSPVEEKGTLDYYILSTGGHPSVISVDRNSKNVKELSEEQAKELIKRVEERKAKEARENNALDVIDNVEQAKPTDANNVELDSDSFTIDEETGEMIPVNSQESLSTEEKSHSSNEGSSSINNVEDNTHISTETQSNEKTESTQSFADLMGNKKYTMSILRLAKNKWKDAPKKIQDLEKFLRDKNIEVDSIGTSKVDIDAWIKTIEVCR